VPHKDSITFLGEGGESEDGPKLEGRLNGAKTSLQDRRGNSPGPREKDSPWTKIDRVYQKYG